MALPAENGVGDVLVLPDSAAGDAAFVAAVTPADRPAPAPEASESRVEEWRQVFDGVMDEGFMNLAPMQRSVASGALASIPLNYQERRIYHLHEEIDRVIGPERIPEELRVAPVLEPFWETAG